MSGEDQQESEHPPFITDRDRAMLTQGDREVLLGEKEYDNSQQQNNATFRVREHIRKSLLDIALIKSACPQEELTKIQQRQYDVYNSHILLRPELDLFILGYRFAHSSFENDSDIGESKQINQSISFEEYLEKELETAFRNGQMTIDGDTVFTKLSVDIDIETEQYKSEKFLNDIVSQPVTENKIREYTSREGLKGKKRIQDYLIENDETITIVDSDSGEDSSVEIGPDHEILSETVSPKIIDELRETFDQQEALKKLLSEPVGTTEFGLYLEEGDVELLRQKLIESDENIEVMTYGKTVKFGPNDKTILDHIDTD